MLLKLYLLHDFAYEADTGGLEQIGNKLKRLNVSWQRSTVVLALLSVWQAAKLREQKQPFETCCPLAGSRTNTEPKHNMSLNG